ncbi:MAG: GAF domain-containing protein [Deltaproteobacteria bacterium]|nr:GAF domain-containing protein [Deltaproteobacteria bacterium]
MTEQAKLLQILLSIMAISNDHRLAFREKLERVLGEIVSCMQAKRGSIMLLKGRKALEVVASTHPDALGARQVVDEKTPSGWVVRHKKPLYVDKATQNALFPSRVGRYEKSAFLIVPIISNTRVIGVLNVTDKIGEDLFEHMEQEILLQIAGLVINTLETQRLAESLKKSKKALEKKNLQLKRLEKVRTDLFNMLIHDLKGPISEMVANLDILSYTISEENRLFVESAQQGCSALQTMVSNLLDIARLEEGRLELVFEKIDPADLVTEALGRLVRVGKTRELLFEKVFPPQPDQRPFSADRGVLLRVLQNLLTNAIRYSPERQAIQVGFDYPGPSKIRFFVKDHGPGVPARHRKAIFEKYTQIDKQTDGRMYTAGMGLAFCKMAVRAHRGRIGVKDEVPMGSCFWFELPMCPKMARPGAKKNRPL